MSLRNRLSLRRASALLACAFLWWGNSTPAVGQGAFPPRLDSYFTKVLKLTADERRVLLSGAPLAKNLEADPSKEVAIFGAIWVAAPIAAYVAALQDIENFEKGARFPSHEESQRARTHRGLRRTRGCRTTTFRICGRARSATAS